MENYGFIKLCYGVVGSYMDTSKMTVDDVVKEFLRREGVSSANEYYEKLNSNTYGKLKQEILTKQDKSDIIKDKWSNGLTPRGHVQERIEDEAIYAFVANELGVSEDQAIAYVDAIMGFCDNSSELYRKTRKYQQGKIPSVAEGINISALSETIESYIMKAPRWNGGETFRGVSIEDEKLKTYHPGYVFDMGGTASWSTNMQITKSFTSSHSSYNRPNPVIYHCSTQTKGTSIRHLSVYEFEDEVLCSKESKYKILKTVKDRDNITHVYLEEVR